jgi:hypothetical protein
LNEAIVAERKWQFKTKFRAKAYGWRGSRLAISRLKEAVSEIKAAAKSDPVAAGDGAVSLMERIWPAFQDIDTSSGALGTAVARTLDELIPILIDAPADHSTRSKWLKRLFEAVQDDGVQYLSPVEVRLGATDGAGAGEAGGDGDERSEQREHPRGLADTDAI